MRKEDLKARLLATFRTEAGEHLQAIRGNLLALEKGLSPGQAGATVEETFRAMHTLKGAARSVSLREVEGLCQACESVLSRMARGQLGLTPVIVDALHRAADGLGRLVAEGPGALSVSDVIREIEAVAGGLPAEGAARPAPLALTPGRAPAAPPPDTIRVATAKLDGLLVQAEELLVPKLAAVESARDGQGLVEALSECRRALNVRGPGNGGEGPARSLDAALHGAEVRARELLTRLVRDRRAIAATVDGLQSEARRLRMSPASTLLEAFPAMVRDLAREQGKDVEWIDHGIDHEVDRKVLEAVKEPLLHLVRNAVDHGIEAPEERSRAGKASRGRITATVAPLEGGRVEIRVEDDGRGIDPARVKAAAIRSRLLSQEQAEALTDEEALDLVYRSGVSTSPMITEVSGHGLGLAIARERVERLGGGVGLETRVGVGTSVRLALPASIATFRGLLVAAGGGSFLLPHETVVRVLRIADEEVRPVEGRQTLFFDGQPLAVAPLSALLGLPDGNDGNEPAERGARHPCVIVAVGDERLALRVAEILGERDVLVKDLRPPLVRVRNVAGAGLLGTNELALILRPGDLIRSAREAHRPSPPAASPEAVRRALRILVVDDSITTRTMERNLLEAAGYEVRVAVDGMDAWTALKSEEFDLVVADVDMPRMDGVELARRIRADRRLAELPVVLVTALESREDKERGIEAGANAYVVKSSFDQSNLLEIIGRLA